MLLRFWEMGRLHLLGAGGVELWCEQSLERGVGSSTPVFACVREESQPPEARRWPQGGLCPEALTDNPTKHILVSQISRGLSPVVETRL